MYDNPSLVQNFYFKVPRYSRKQSNLLEVPSRRSILGNNSPMSRFCVIVNEKKALDPFGDCLYKYRRNAMECI